MMYEIMTIASGVVGAMARIIVQYLRDGKLPHDLIRLGFELILGGIAGWLVFLLIYPTFTWPEPELLGFAAGYFAPDFVENVARIKLPKPEK